jgi:hypothetical protein
LEDECGKQYELKYIAYKTGLSAGWRQFSAAHKLLEGDVLIFQLVEPTKFKVMIYLLFSYIYIVNVCLELLDIVMTCQDDVTTK